MSKEINDVPSRAALRLARRVCVKAGTSVVANDDGRPSLTRMAAIVEQIAELTRQGVEVVFVSSGAVGMGKRVLRQQGRLRMTLKDMHQHQEQGGAADEAIMDRSSKHGPSRGSLRRIPSTGSFTSMLQEQQRPQTLMEKKKTYDSACAAAGQFEMMNLYNSLFTQVDVSASQILVTQSDFVDEQRLNNLSYSIDRLLSLGIVPIINENDAVSANTGYTDDHVFSDNDSLAALCARSFGAEVLLLLTDVDGVYDSSPKENPNAKLLSFYQDTTEVSIGKKSTHGRGGMAAKIDAAMSAVETGSSCVACVVASGADLNCIRAVLGASPAHGSRGTLFACPGSDLEAQALADSAGDNQVSYSACGRPVHLSVLLYGRCRFILLKSRPVLSVMEPLPC